MLLLDFRMPLRDQEGEDSREFSPAEKMFVCNSKISGEKHSCIYNLFTTNFGKVPPGRQGIFNMVRNLRNKFTVLDLRKGRCRCSYRCCCASPERSSNCTQTSSQWEKTLVSLLLLEPLEAF